MSNATIQTFTGVHFDLLNPKPELIRIEDIAHSLAMLPRYTGHPRFPYVVAQHLIIGSYQIPDPYKWDYFGHDMSEAYLNDMSRPLKHFTKAGKEYKKIERRVQKAIATALGFSVKEPKIVKVYDNRMLYTEKQQLMATDTFYFEWAKGTEPLPITLKYQDFWTIEREFLARYHELKGK